MPKMHIVKGPRYSRTEGPWKLLSQSGVVFPAEQLFLRENSFI